MISSVLHIVYTALINMSISTDVSVPRWAIDNYGQRIEFTISRNGKKVGLHTVNFDTKNSGTVVESTTEIKIKFLFFTAYRFYYNAKEIWLDNTLKTVESITKDGNDEISLAYNFSADNDLFTTNHWNPEILNNTSVYNTITGKINEINIINKGWEKVRTGTGMRKAIRYDYEGDLQNISAWYDEKMRWVGLQFEARDGSIITYECENCGA